MVSSSKQETIAGAGYAGDARERGRIVALAHTSLFGSAAGSAWTKNILTWAARKEGAKVMLIGANEKELGVSGFQFVPPPKPVGATASVRVDVLVANLHNALFVEMETFIAEHLKKGGGLVLLATPWAASKAALASTQRLLEGSGLAYVSAGPHDASFPIHAAVSPYLNALPAAEALLEEEAGTLKLSLADRQLCCATLEACIDARVLGETLKTQLNTLHFRKGWITIDKEHLLRKAKQPVEAMIARYQSQILQTLPPEKTPAHPSASDYPGAVGEGPALTRAVEFNANTGPDKFINHGDKTRISTGLYARPGVAFQVVLPASATGAGLQLEVGIHTDVNWPLAHWRRCPQISRTFSLNAVETKAANAFGGLISILVPADCSAGAVSAVFSGAVEAPVFTLGRTTEAEWNARVKNAPGAWGYLETPKWTGYFPSDFLRTLEHPEAVATYWQRVLDTADTILGYSAWRRRGESMLVDRDVVVGYGHAGYPVMMGYGAESLENHNALAGRGPEKGDWGFLHELGHTFQDSWDGNYGIASHGEVDVNLVPALVLSLIHNRTAWDNNSHGTFDANKRIADLQKWNARPEAERTWPEACKTSVGYDFYFTLAECFGWTLYQKVFGRWMNWLQQPGSDPALDALDARSPNAKRDRFFLLFCQESGRNLLPHFKRYGLGSGGYEISPQVFTQTAGLPVWSGNQPITALEGPAEIRLPRRGSEGEPLAVFRALDPDPGTVFTYRIISGNEKGCFEIGLRTGRLSRRKGGDSPGACTLGIEVQDNCIPLSTRQGLCRILPQ
ncbi:MAG: enhancin and enhancin-like [Verrucomicrobia bacterium]|nr:MAG: enhancin and enhancin-like [Verrucomicrobiota bacterium]